MFFQSDEEIVTSMRIDKKLDSVHWDLVESKYGKLNLADEKNYVKILLIGGFTQRQIENLGSVHRKITTARLYRPRKMIQSVKTETQDALGQEIECGIENLKLTHKGDKIERKITWWRLKNPAPVVVNWLNRDIADIHFHTSQNPEQIQLTITGDHFGKTYAIYIGRVNVLEPNSPNNFLPLATVSNTNDCEQIISRIIEPVIENLCSLQTIKLDFSPFAGKPRQPPTKTEIPLGDFPTHTFSTPNKYRGPENLLCYQLGEIKKESPIDKENIKMCDTCYRKFENEHSLLMHKQIDHEDLTKRKQMDEIHPDFFFYTHHKGDNVPKTKFLAALDELIIFPK